MRDSPIPCQPPTAVPSRDNLHLTLTFDLMTFVLTAIYKKYDDDDDDERHSQGSNL